ncbi:MAG: DegV family EDD domain-containing protein, partial [Dehalococcoidia bacterium]|nr:DegV family EDD domain-containing protein [Dehalococcoidia bacterium]
MTVKIVTDSTSDLPPQLADELGITVVPVYLRFGEMVYRDGVDISHDEFYQKLVESPVHPSTSQPTPADFADVYSKLAKETDEIVSIH